jgi:hypothetical protein
MDCQPNSPIDGKHHPGHIGGRVRSQEDDRPDKLIEASAASEEGAPADRGLPAIRKPERPGFWEDRQW